MSTVVFVLPEDRARNAPEVMRRLVRCALDAIGRSGADIVFGEVPQAIAAVAVRRGWAGGRRKDHVAFVQWIATQLGIGRVVVVHYDADVAWSGRARCDNRRQFDKNVRQRVAHQIATDNLVEMVPFAIIEAWTYRNTPVALACSAGHALHAEASRDPGLLEERTTLKRDSPLGDTHNLRLVTEDWPAADAYADERSFQAFADALGASPAFG